MNKNNNESGKSSVKSLTVQDQSAPFRKQIAGHSYLERNNVPAKKI